MQKISGRSITLRDFSLMRDNSQIYYAENFKVENYGFGNVLIPGNYGTKYADENTATLTKYAGNAFRNFRGVDVLDEGGAKYLYWIDESSNIWCANELTATGQKLFNTNEACWYPDLKATGTDENSSIIYTTKDSIGRIHRGEATGGSSTELDDTGVDFTAMGGAGHLIAVGDYVYNIKDNKLFTISAIAATKLTVTAVDGGDFASGDEYCIVDPNWQALTDDNYQYGRQIIEFDQDFYALNGDYLAIVDSSMAYTAEHKAIESGWIARCGASNGDTLAVGCNKNNQGKIFFWDKHSNGWIKKMSLDNEIQSIEPYGNNYIYISGNGIWMTDGYSKRKLAPFPDIRSRNAVTVIPHGMKVIENKLIINTVTGRLNRSATGLYIYDLLKNEFSYSPFDPGTTIADGKAGYNCGGGIVFFESWLDYIYYTFTNSGYGWTNGYITSRLWLESNENKGVIITNPIRLGKNARIKKIEVNLINNTYEYGNYDTQSMTVDLKLSNAKKALWPYTQAKIDSTELDKITVDGTINGFADAVKGDEILIRDGWNGFERRKIENIADAGTATEVWTLDSALPNLIKQSTLMNVIPFQRYGMTPVTNTTDEFGMLEFYPDFYGDSVMIELIITGTTQAPTPAIESIKIYYE